MSKRKLLIIILLALSATLLLVCAAFFAACGDDKTLGDGQNTEQGGEYPNHGNDSGIVPGGDDEPGTDPDDDKDVAVISVALNEDSLALEVGENYTLVATVSPSNATDNTISWSSADPYVASVSGGKITAKSEGATTITATAHNGKSASCTVTVNELAPEVIEVTSVSLNKTSLTLEIGASETLTATVLPGNATDKSVTWTSSDPSVATVVNDKVTAIGNGTATIIVTTNNGKTAFCTVAVSEPAPEVIEVTSVSLDKTSLTFEIGESETLTAIVLPNDATDKSVTWTSSDQSVATVAGGKITAVGRGTATIAATSHNGKTAICEVTVKTALPEITQVEGAMINGTDIYMFVDHTTDSVALLNRVTVSSGKWSLYSDILGQNKIPTKIAAGSNGKLLNGDNVFYIMLEDENGDLAEVYTLTIYRSYAVTVSYYNHKNVLMYSETAYTGYEYALNYDYTTPGYTFHDWTENGAIYQTRILWDELSLYADMRANSYTVELDANGGTVSADEQEVTYDTARPLPVPERMGYTFLGWYSKEIRFTDEYGQPLPVWQLTEDKSLTAKWKINKYDVAVEYDDNVGTVTGVGTYDYATEITCTASAPILGYTFSGWYLNGELVTTENTYCFVLGANDVTLLAKYELTKEMSVFTFTSTTTSCIITGIKDKTAKEIVVPDYVTEIEEGAFSGCASLESITLPFVGGSASATNASASTLFGYIFGTSSYTGGTGTTQYYANSYYTSSYYGYYYIPTSLRSVTITGGNLFYGAFYDCSGLTSVTIGNDVTSIESSAFERCRRLTNVYITDLSAWCRISFSNFHSNPLSYAQNLYLNGELVTDLVIPSDITSIGKYVFGGYSRLTSVEIHDRVTSIYGAFYNCDGLKRVNITDMAAWCSISLSAATDNPLYYAGNLYLNGKLVTKLVIPDGVEKIAFAAFYGCRSFTSVNIPNSVTNIEKYAFSDCSSLISVTIPDSVKSLGSYAFQNCSNLTDMTIGKCVTSIGNYAFYGCRMLTTIYYNAIAIDDLTSANYIFCDAGDDTGITIVFGDTVKTIPAYLFYVSYSSYRPNLISVTIGSNVTRIGSSAFEGCHGLTKVHITDIAAWCAIEFNNSTANPLYYAHNLYLSGKLITDLIIPNSVTSIGNYTFYNCSGLTSTTIPDSVISIGNYAFEGCSGLINVTIGNSVTRIGEHAFYNCVGITQINYNAISVNNSSSSSAVFVNAGSNSNGITVVFGDDVQTIPAYLFTESRYIISVTIGNGVTNIEKSAFSGCSGLTSVMISGSVTNIGDSAFSSCNGLTSITIPDSVKSIGSYAFRGCSGLTSVTIGNGVKSIGSYAFRGCSGLTSVTIPNSVTSIEDSTFEDCSGLTSVTIGNSVTSIGRYAFRDCSSLTSVTIPDNVTNIGNSAFSNCSNLTSITISDSVTSIGGSAFSNCISLKNATIPHSVTSIGNSAFFGCSSLTSITLPFVGGKASAADASASTLFGYIFGTSSYTGGTSAKQFYANSYYEYYYIPTSLKNVTITGGDLLYGAFFGCSGLTSVTIGNGVTNIGDSAFCECSGLTSVTIGNSVTSIGGSAFRYCSNLKSIAIPDNVTSIGDSAFYECSGLMSITIGNSVTSIGRRAFYDCSGLMSVTIGNGVTNIGDSAFYKCSGMTEVHITDIATWCAIEFDGIPANPLYYAHNLYLNDKFITDLVITDNVKSIGDLTFYGCSGLTSVTIGNGVTSIGGSAFFDCSGLTSVTIGNSVTSIKSSAFSGCSGLTEIHISDIAAWCAIEFDGITANPLYYAHNLYLNGKFITELIIPDSVTSIGDYAFGYCNNLTSITIPNSVTSIGRRAFFDCSGLTSVTIGNGVTSVESSAFSECNGLTEVHITDLAAWCTIEFNDSTANPLYHAHNLYLSGKLITDLVIPDSITNIGECSFYNCSGLTSVTIGNGVTSIGISAFSGCSGLTSITIPDNVTSIGNNAFGDCSGLTSVTIGNGVTSIGGSAFNGCNRLTSITIPDSVKSNGNNAFSDCSGLTSVTIGNNVTSIGTYAFSDCSRLTSVVFEHPNGWWYSYDSTATSGASIPGPSLANASTAAKYLNSTYTNRYWKRS